MLKIDWSDSEAVGWFLYEFASTTILAVLEWNADRCKLGRGGDLVSEVVFLKVATRYVEKCQDSSLKRDFDKAFWDCIKTEDADLMFVSSIKEQRAFV